MSNDQPRWGDTPSNSEEPPRYGERIVPTPSSAPVDPADDVSGEGAHVAHTDPETRDDDDRDSGDAPTRAYEVPPVHGPTSAAGSDAPTTAFDQPRYGEQHTDQPRYDQPRYDQPRYDQPRYGEQDQYGRQPTSAQHDPWQHQAPAYGSGASAAAWDDRARTRKPRTVGLVAFIVGLLALILGLVVALLWGNVFSNVPAIHQMISAGSGMTEAQQQQLSQDVTRQLANDPSLRVPFTIGTFGLLGGTVLGLWAIVQGIIAIATRRGRALGVIGLILGVIAPIVLVMVLGATIAAQA